MGNVGHFPSTYLLRTIPICRRRQAQRAELEHSFAFGVPFGLDLIERKELTDNESYTSDSKRLRLKVEDQKFILPIFNYLIFI